MSKTTTDTAQRVRELIDRIDHINLTDLDLQPVRRAMRNYAELLELAPTGWISHKGLDYLLSNLKGGECVIHRKPPGHEPNYALYLGPKPLATRELDRNEGVI